MDDWPSILPLIGVPVLVGLLVLVIAEAVVGSLKDVDRD